jgi:branched-chain amino acid transport system ATP-binding protein
MLLDVRDLRVAFGESQILHDVSFGVRSGGITALLGRNGAGKTTTLRGILGLTPRSGSVRLEGAYVRTRSCGAASGTCRRIATCSVR